MDNRLKIFRRVVKELGRGHAKRKLYTDSIYPYPNNYFNNVVFPGQVLYRETWRDPAILPKYNLIAKWGFRFFWTYFFWNLFREPEVLLGHYDIPDPRNFTDAELGIPPETEGPYEEWLKKMDTED